MQPTTIQMYIANPSMPNLDKLLKSHSLHTKPAHVHTHTHTYTHTHTHTQQYAFIHTHAQAYSHARARACTHTHTHTARTAQHNTRFIT